MKGFVFTTLTMAPAFMLKALVGVLNSTLPKLVPAGWGACTLMHLGVAFGGTVIAMLLGFLPTDAPPKRGSCSEFCSSSTFYVYLLHLSALLNGATALPLGFAWNQLKNDLFALLPIPATASVGATVVTVLVQVVLCVVLAVFKMGMARANATPLATRLCPPPVAARHQLVQYKMLEYMQAWAIYDILVTIWGPVTLSPCAASTFPTLLPGSQHWTAPVVLLGVLSLSILCALYPPPEKLAGSKLLGTALGLLVATLGIQLGWAFKDSYLGLVGFFLPSRASVADLALIYTFLGVITVLLVLDHLHKAPGKPRQLV